MSWFKLRHGELNEPRFEAIGAQLGLPAVLVAWTGVALADHASRQELPGTIDNFDAERWARFTGQPVADLERIVTAMVQRGLVVDGCLDNRSWRVDTNLARVRRHRETRTGRRDGAAHVAPGRVTGVTVNGVTAGLDATASVRPPQGRGEAVQRLAEMSVVDEGGAILPPPPDFAGINRFPDGLCHWANSELSAQPSGMTVAAGDTITIEHVTAGKEFLAEQDDQPDLSGFRASVLRAALADAAGGNVDPAASDVTPIQALLADEGCVLDLDVLPVVREFVAPAGIPLKRWGAPWLLDKIRARHKGRMVADIGLVRTSYERLPADTPFAPPTAGGRTLPTLGHVMREEEVRREQHPPAPDPRPAARPPTFDMDELVGGYRAGNVEWDAARFGPPPGTPGCRVDAAILRENGY